MKINLKDGETCTVMESEGGGVEVWYKHGTYFAFTVPRYGGKPVFEYQNNSLSTFISTISKWG